MARSSSIASIFINFSFPNYWIHVLSQITTKWKLLRDPKKCLPIRDPIPLETYSGANFTIKMAKNKLFEELEAFLSTTDEGKLFGLMDLFIR